MSHYRMLNSELAAPEIRCARCLRKSFAAARNRDRICLICEAFLRRRQGR